MLFAVSTSNVELQNFVAKYLFEAVIQGLTLESNAMIHADLVSLCREIFVHFSNRHSAPKEVPLSLPFVTQDSFSTFETVLSRTSGSKEQKGRFSKRGLHWNSRTDNIDFPHVSHAEAMY